MSPYSKTHVSINLYTKPDPESTGGIKGVLAEAPSEVLGVLAMPQKFPTVSALGDIEGGTAAKNARNVNSAMINPVYLAALGSDNAFLLLGSAPPQI
jgi:hypothetical protein